MSSKKIVITSVFLLLILSLIVNAQNDLFSVKAENNVISALPCSVLTESIQIVNNGDSQDKYTISKDGSAADFSKITPGIFSLKPGQFLEINNEINVPCDISGEYSLTTSIESDLGVEKEIVQIISVKSQNNLFLVPKVDNIETCPCTQGIFKFEIINPGHYPETYLINIDKYEEYITLSENSVEVSPNTKSEFFVFTMFPCDEYGLYDFTVSVETKNSKLIAKKDLSLDILPCYQFDVSLGDQYIGYIAPVISEETTKDNIIYPKSSEKEFILKEDNKSYSVCNGKESIIPLKIENKAKIANNYYIDIKGSEFVSINYDAISLKAGKSSILEISIDPEAKNSQKIELEILTERGKLKKIKSFEINSIDCYTPFISKQEKEIYVNFSNMVTPILLENKGYKDSNYILEIKESNWQKIAPSIISIGGNSSKNFFIQTIPDDKIKKGKHVVELNIISLNDNITYSESIIINLKDKNIIFENLEIAKNGIISNLSYIIFAVIIIFIVMVIFLFLTRKEPKKKSEEKKIKKEIKKEATKVEKTEKKIKKEPQKIWPYVLALIIVILIFTGIYCGGDVINSFNYSSDPLYDEPKESIEELDIEIEPVHEEYISGIFNKIKVYMWYIINGLVLLLFIILWLIYSNSNKKNKKNIKKILIILLLIIVILIIIFSTIKYFPKSINMSVLTGTSLEFPEEELINVSEEPIIEESIILDEKGIQTQIWDEDNIHTIDLNDYFNDPDSDSLYFSNTYDENIDISIDEGGIVTFTPKKNWNGNTTIKFIVDDGMGGVIESNDVVLVVNSVPESISDSLNGVKESSKKMFDYCYIFCKDYFYYIVFGVIILLILIFILKFNKNILEFLDEEEPKKKKVKKK